MCHWKLSLKKWFEIFAYKKKRFLLLGFYMNRFFVIKRIITASNFNLLIIQCRFTHKVIVSHNVMHFIWAHKMYFYPAVPFCDELCPDKCLTGRKASNPSNKHKRSSINKRLTCLSWLDFLIHHSALHCKLTKTRITL